MIRPAYFTFNAETAVNNSFQTQTNDITTQTKALQEFDSFVHELTQKGVDVTVVQDTLEPHTPDSIFPNNWVSFHNNGTVCLYPMFALNRRQERRQEVIDAVQQKFHLKPSILDFTHYEQDNIFLEGTGSMVLDRENKIAYACISPRTNEKILNDFCTQLKYTPVLFHAVDANNTLIYHTNVMMCVADKYAVICLESIRDKKEKEGVIHFIHQTKKELIEISLQQMNHFAGNMLQVENASGEKLLVMSSQAYQSLTAVQIEQLENYNKIVHSSLNAIETNGGGSARCMMAEVFV
jgi:hypothetical protein